MSRHQVQRSAQSQYIPLVQTVRGALHPAPIYGSNPYTSDSDLPTAAVHAGILKPGEIGTVLLHQFTRLAKGAPTKFTSTRQHGIRSMAWDTPEPSFIIQRVEDEEKVTVRSSRSRHPPNRMDMMESISQKPAAAPRRSVTAPPSTNSPKRTTTPKKTSKKKAGSTPVKSPNKHTTTPQRRAKQGVKAPTSSTSELNSPSPRRRVTRSSIHQADSSLDSADPNWSTLSILAPPVASAQASNRRSNPRNPPATAPPTRGRRQSSRLNHAIPPPSSVRRPRPKTPPPPPPPPSDPPPPRRSRAPTHGAAAAMSSEQLNAPFDIRNMSVTDKYELKVKGSNKGLVFGSNPYASFSHVSSAAVHSGLVQLGEIKTVWCRHMSGFPQSVRGCSRNGITSSSFSNYHDFFQLLPAGGHGGSSSSSAQGASHSQRQRQQRPPPRRAPGSSQRPPTPPPPPLRRAPAGTPAAPRHTRRALFHVPPPPPYPPPPPRARASASNGTSSNLNGPMLRRPSVVPPPPPRPVSARALRAALRAR